MTGKDLADILHNAPVDEHGMYRAVASYYLTGTPLGPFRYHGTRRDDPNDTVPHEHRRELRGLRLICAWLGHDDSRSINTLDLLVNDGGRQFVKHYLIDFGSTLGSASYGPNSPRSGNEYVFSWKAPAAEFFTLGLYAPRWTRANFPKFPSVGRFESAVFDPVKWVPEYKNPAFLNELSDDSFWAARQIVAFTDDDIRAVVASGRYSDPAAAEWVTKCLIERRDKIGRAYLAKALALDRFSVHKGELQFSDIGALHKMSTPREYSITWSEFDNATHSAKALAGAHGRQMPRVKADYLRATIRGGDDRRSVDVYIRNPAAEPEVVGVERHW